MDANSEVSNGRVCCKTKTYFKIYYLIMYVDGNVLDGDVLDGDVLDGDVCGTGTSSLCKVVDSKAQMYQSDSELVALHRVLKDSSCSPMLFRQDGVLAFCCLHC